MRTVLVLLLALVMVGCGTDAGADRDADLTAAELDALAARLASASDRVTEAECDVGGLADATVGTCYIGLRTSSKAEAEAFLCSTIVPVIEERTDRRVALVAFDAATDQVTATTPDC